MLVDLYFPLRGATLPVSNPCETHGVKVGQGRGKQGRKMGASWEEAGVKSKRGTRQGNGGGYDQITPRLCAKTPSGVHFHGCFLPARILTVLISLFFPVLGLEPSGRLTTHLFLFFY